MVVYFVYVCGNSEYCLGSIDQRALYPVPPRMPTKHIQTSDQERGVVQGLLFSVCENDVVDLSYSRIYSGVEFGRLQGSQTSTMRGQVRSRWAWFVKPGFLKRVLVTDIRNEEITHAWPPIAAIPPPLSLQEKGLVAPRTSHDDAVLDVKVTELPTKMLLSGSRDGAVKIWK